jgi:drug/metabolite transporter (DMT)-like permease
MTGSGSGQSAAARTHDQPLAATTRDRLNRVAPIVFLILWSSSFLGTRVGLRHMSPLLFVAIRMVLAAGIMVGIMAWRRRPWRLPPVMILHCAVTGVLAQSILLMTAHSAMVRTQAAPIALIQTLNPLLSALLAWPLLGERLRPSQIAGLLLGFAGVLLVLGRAAAGARAELPALLATVGGVFAMVGGTLYYRHFCRTVPAMEGATIQLLAAAAMCSACAVLLETPRFDGDGIVGLAIAWNAVVVTIGGMSLYFLMLSLGTAARATVNFYLIPGFTSILTWLLLNETLTPAMIAGLLISSVGCWLVGRTAPCASLK